MLQAESSAEIGRPPETVFSFLAEVDNLPLWATGVVEANQLSPGPLKEGTELEHVLSFLGKRFTARFETTQYEPNKRLAFTTISGPIHLETVITLQPADGVTTVRYMALGETRGFFKVAEPVLVKIATRQLQSSLGNLKDLLEAPPGE